MNEHYENIKNKTVCTECGGKEMDLAYVHDAAGAVKTVTKVLGMQAYKGVGNLLIICCRKCGFVAKSFAVGR